MNKVKTLRRIAVSGIALGIFVLPATIVNAKPASAITVKGSGAGSFIDADFSFDGTAFGSLSIESGSDSFGGQFNSQDISEYVATTTACTAPIIALVWCTTWWMLTRYRLILKPATRFGPSPTADRNV